MTLHECSRLNITDIDLGARNIVWRSVRHGWQTRALDDCLEAALIQWLHLRSGVAAAGELALFLNVAGTRISVAGIDYAICQTLI